MTKAVIFDFDGTLCNTESVRHLVKRENPDLETFHIEALDCPPNDEVKVLAKRMYETSEYVVLIVTSRPQKWADATKGWLEKHGIDFHHYFCRSDDDDRHDYLVKQDILLEIREMGLDPILALDDSPAVIKMWKENNIPVLEIPGYY
jgi:FMN phosphatase YigB (HAD superfamily)